MINRIKSIVELYPNKIAYKIDNDCITYKELWDKSNLYADYLRRQGSSPVVVYGNKEINVVVSILACIISNRPYVPLGTCTPLNRIKKIIGITEATLILTDRELDIKNIEISSINELSKYKDGSIKNYKNNTIYIIFTSGSTGEPKGVPISNDNLNNFVNWISNLEPLNTYKDINVLNQASFSFDLSVADFYYSLCNGHTLIAFDGDVQDDYEKLFDILTNINVAVMTPTFMKLCLLNEKFNRDNYSNLKCIYFCGELLETKTVQKIFERFPNIKIINAYGPTEATSAVSASLITSDMINEKLLPVGDVSTFATDIEIINDEIVLKGKSVFSGYLGNTIGGYYNEDNINCYKTGDIGYIENGKLYCKGRIDNQIKYKGYRIELSEIEYNINLIDGVKECAVVAKYNDDGIVKLIKAFVVTDTVNESSIKEELKKYVPEYMIPKSIKIVDQLPMNQNGKVDRKALSEL